MSGTRLGGGGAAAGTPPAGVQGAPELRRERLAAERPLDEPDGLGRCHQPDALAPVGGQNRVDPGWRQVTAEFGPRGPVSGAGPGDAGGQMMAGQRSESDRMALEDSVHPVIGRNHVKQPGHCCLLEPLAAGRMNAIRPASGKMNCHRVSIA